MKLKEIFHNDSQCFWKVFWYAFVFGGILIGAFEYFCVHRIYSYVNINKEHLNLYGRFLSVFGAPSISLIGLFYAVYIFLLLYRCVKVGKSCKIFLIFLYFLSVFSYSLVNCPLPSFYLGHLLSNKLVDTDVSPNIYSI